MRPEAIFGPMSALALWTGCVLLVTAFRRIRGVLSRRIPIKAFRPGETAEVPYDVVIANRNLMNLLEMPMLFYVVSLSLYVTREVDPLSIGLAWVYVALRFVHSSIHLTSNRVTHRLIPFALSNFVLVGLWIVLIRGVL